ncbi:hypothetical protein [Streptomyces parvus]|uniref:hypothetical protein n=1 Tax=Streptomyces parvus TaxID=66428 RepID=UPI0033DECD4F
MPENTDTTPHQHAAAMAYAWAQRAEDHHTKADAARARAAEQEDPRGTYAVRLLQQHEADITKHTEQATTAQSMAQMWARVATAQPT